MLLRVPARVQEFRVRIDKASAELVLSLGHNPTIQEIAEHIGEDEERVSDILQAYDHSNVISLDGHQDCQDYENSCGQRDMHETLTYDPVPEEEIVDRMTLKDEIARLKPRQQQVLQLIFHEGLNQTETARRLGISQDYVSDLLRRSIERLKNRLTRTYSQRQK